VIRSISPRTPRATLGATWGAVLGAILLAGCTTGADIKALQENGEIIKTIDPKLIMLFLMEKLDP